MSNDVGNPRNELLNVMMRYAFRPKHLDLIAFLEGRVQADRNLLGLASQHAAPDDIMEILQASLATMEGHLEKARADLAAFDAKYPMMDAPPS